MIDCAKSFARLSRSLGAFRKKLSRSGIRSQTIRSPAACALRPEERKTRQIRKKEVRPPAVLRFRLFPIVRQFDESSQIHSIADRTPSFLTESPDRVK